MKVEDRIEFSVYVGAGCGLLKIMDCLCLVPDVDGELLCMDSKLCVC